MNRVNIELNDFTIFPQLINHRIVLYYKFSEMLFKNANDALSN